MLTIPGEVKALYRRDVQEHFTKNFHVHFPDGEFRDLNNSDIVAESVSFRESICSQQYFRFGLTEGSMIEFECVGVPDIYGVHIQCAIEIDITSLGAEFIEAHTEQALLAAGTDGPSTEAGVGISAEYYGNDFLQPGICFFPDGTAAYRIPYGDFVVKSCPRNHQQMAHRRVTAYAKTFTNNYAMSPFEQWWQAAPITDETKTFNVTDFVATSTNVLLPDYDTSVDKTALFTADTVPVMPMYLRTGTSPQWTYYTLFVQPDTYYTADDDAMKANADVVQIVLNRNRGVYEEMMSDIRGLLEDYDVKGANGYGESYTTIPDMLKSACIVSQAGFGYIMVYSDTMTRGSIFGTAETTVLNPNYPSASGYGIWSIATAVTVQLFEGSLETPSGTPIFERHYDILESFEAYGLKIASRDTLQQQTFTANATLQYEVTTVTPHTEYTYYNSFSFSKILNGYLELNAQFGTQDRTNNYKVMRISDGGTENVIPSEYESIWWDDYTVNNVGAVSYNFADSSSGRYQFGNGESSYSMYDNGLLQALPELTKQNVDAIIDARFVPHLAGVVYTPSDIDLMAMPWIEAGDMISATAEDGTIVNILVMQQQISGIQTLKASVQASGGRI